MSAPKPYMSMIAWTRVARFLVTLTISILVLTVFAGCFGPSLFGGPASGTGNLDPASDGTLIHDSCGLVSMVASSDDPRWKIKNDPLSFRINLQRSQMVQWAIAGDWVALEVIVGPATNDRPFDAPMANQVYPNETGQNVLFYNVETMELLESGPCAHSEDPYRCAVHRLYGASDTHFIYTRPAEPGCGPPKDVVVREVGSGNATSVRLEAEGSFDDLRPHFADGRWVVFKTVTYGPNGLATYWLYDRTQAATSRFPVDEGYHLDADESLGPGVRILDDKAYYFATEGHYRHPSWYRNESTLFKWDLESGERQSLFTVPSSEARVRGVLDVNDNWVLWSRQPDFERVMAYNQSTGNWFDVYPNAPYSGDGVLVDNRAMFTVSGTSIGRPVPYGVYEIDLLSRERRILVEDRQELEFWVAGTALAPHGMLIHLLNVRGLDSSMYAADAEMAWLPFDQN